MGHCLCVHAEQARVVEPEVKVQADQHQQDVEPFPGKQGGRGS